MNVKQALIDARKQLESRSIEDYPLEAEVLLRYVLNLDRANLYLSLDRKLTDSEREEFRQIIGRRCSGEPAAYITGRREFYGLDFLVTTAVLIPRPETELLVEKALEFAFLVGASSAADIGTGSGVIAVSLARHLPALRIYATDVSAGALEVARRNCRRHGVEARVRLLHGDMLGPLPEAVDIIVANLPYVAEGDCACLPDPRLALDGGPDGLDCLRRLCLESGAWLNPGGALLVEIGKGQDKALTRIIQEVFTEGRIEAYPDPAGIIRVLSIKSRSALP